MDFFKHQRQAKKESVKLLFLFILATVLVLLLSAGCLLPAIHYTLYIPVFEVNEYTLKPDFFSLTEIGIKVVIAVSAFVIFSVGGGVLIKLFEIGKGGKAIAEMLGARELTRSGLSPLKIQEIQNINAEMAIASGIRPPALYILNDESINALAAGMEIKDSIICLTSGAIKALKREEMSALIAHEFGHILGCDARTNMYLSAVLHGLMMFTVMGKKLFRRRYNLGWPTIVLGILLILVGIIGNSVGRFIQSFYSQEREFLADACAVQFTRSKDALLGIFQKVWYRRFDNRLRSVYAAEVAHFMFTSTTNKAERSASTHPSLKERARRIDAKFRFQDSPPQEYEASSVQTIIPKVNIDTRGPEELLEVLFSSNSFSSLLNFSLLHFATQAVSEGHFKYFKEQIIKMAQECKDVALKLRLWLALEALNEQNALTNEAKGRLPLPRKTRSLASLEIELTIVFSVLIESTNPDHAHRLRSLFKKNFPWSKKLLSVKEINPRSFHRSLDMLAALNIESKKVVHDFIHEVIKLDGRVSYEEEEFFKLICDRLNMTLPH